MACEECELHKTRQRVVPGEGDCANGLMIVGEAPGREEEESGRPFVGIAGKTLRQLLLDAGVNPFHCRIVNTVKCRPPGNRAPTSSEKASCRGNFLAELDKYKPFAILSVGLTSSQALIGTKESMAELQARTGLDGIQCDIGGYKVPVFPVWHTSPLCINRVKEAKSQILQGIQMAILRATKKR